MSDPEQEGIQDDEFIPPDDNDDMRSWEEQEGIHDDE